MEGRKLWQNTPKGVCLVTYSNLDEINESMSRIQSSRSVYYTAWSRGRRYFEIRFLILWVLHTVLLCILDYIWRTRECCYNGGSGKKLGRVEIFQRPCVLRLWNNLGWKLSLGRPVGNRQVNGTGKYHHSSHFYYGLWEFGMDQSVLDCKCLNGIYILANLVNIYFPWVFESLTTRVNALIDDMITDLAMDSPYNQYVLHLLTYISIHSFIKPFINPSIHSFIYLFLLFSYLLIYSVLWVQLDTTLMLVHTYST